MMERTAPVVRRAKEGVIDVEREGEEGEKQRKRNPRGGGG